MQNEHCCMDLILEHPLDSATGYTAWKAIILLLNYRCIMLQFVILRNDLTWIVTVIKLESSTAYVARNQAIYYTLAFRHRTCLWKRSFFAIKKNTIIRNFWSEWEELHLRITLYKNAAYTARATLGLCLALRQTNSTFQLRMSR